MDPDLDREARRLLERYLLEVVERFGLCPWASPARARGEVRVEVVAAAAAAAALDRFCADERAAIGLIVMPALHGSMARLRDVRDVLLASRGAEVAIADFHPEAAIDVSNPDVVVGFLRRSPDPMLQAVRHRTLAGLRRSTPQLSLREQAAAMAGRAVRRPPDPSADVAAANFSTVRAHRPAIEAAIADIARDRAATYGRLIRRA